jgi:hypothetical protein
MLKKRNMRGAAARASPALYMTRNTPKLLRDLEPLEPFRSCGNVEYWIKIGYINKNCFRNAIKAAARRRRLLRISERSGL